MAVASGGRVRLQLATAVTPGQVHTDQQAIEASIAAFWRDLLNNVHTPSEQAQRDKTGVLQPHRAGARRRTSHGQLARNNLSTLQKLNARPGTAVTVRTDAGPPPARLRRLADQAAQSGDLRSRHPADCASHANAPWDELRVWDPGD